MVPLLLNFKALKVARPKISLQKFSLLLKLDGKDYHIIKTIFTCAKSYLKTFYSARGFFIEVFYRQGSPYKTFLTANRSKLPGSINDRYHLDQTCVKYTLVSCKPIPIEFLLQFLR